MMSHPPQQDLYPDVARDDVSPSIPTSARSALDIGCSRGGFGPTLRRALGPDAYIVGVEPVSTQASLAREGHGFDEVVDGYFPDALAGRSDRFDLISFNDVLEHVIDPWQMLRDTALWLNPGGKVLAAIPSIQFAPIVWRLIRGRWDYLDYGTLDRTHLRFFTRATMVEMFEETGYRVLECRGANGVDATWPAEPRLVRRLAKKALLPFLGDSRYIHFVILAEKRTDGS
jgi:2-polyprenyl-3-methyl-5-hydroxy-6-metoxy-1,4-benzoquinol methylase